MLSNEALKKELDALKSQTNNPININFFCHTPPTPNKDAENNWRKALQPFFNEFALRLPKDASEVVSDLIDEGLAAGFPAGRYYEGMENVLLVACTEKRTKKEIDILAAKLEAVL